MKRAKIKVKYLTPYEVWKKVKKEKLTRVEHKQLLIDNKILIKRESIDKEES